MESVKHRSLHFKIYYMATGFGLQKDAAIIQVALNELGHPCEIIQLRVRKERHSRLTQNIFKVLRKFNFLYLYNWFASFWRTSNCVSLHLETIAYEKLFLNERHVLIPNQEWFDTSTMDLLPFMTSIWCKSRFAQNIFSELKLNTEYIGFRSDIGNVPVSLTKTREYFFCRTGMSQFRGASNLISVWRAHPEWPLLKIVVHPSRRPSDCPENVEYVDILPDINDYYKLSTSSQFHIYLTEAEGFGHSIVEAMGCGAVVLVTDAPPMNEIANPECALLIDSFYSGHKMLSPRFAAHPHAVEAAVERALAMSAGEVSLISKNAQLRYDLLAKEFVGNISRVVAAL